MVLRIILLSLLSLSTLLAVNKGVQKIEVKAKNYFLDEKKGLAFLSGDVVITKGKDVLKAGKLDITMKGKKAVKYEAKENPRFHIVLGDKVYNGKGDIFIYDVPKDIYYIIGNAYIKEAKTNKELFGDKIIIDRKKLVYKVESKEKPAKFIFELGE